MQCRIWSAALMWSWRPQRRSLRSAAQSNAQKPRVQNPTVSLNSVARQGLLYAGGKYVGAGRRQGNDDGRHVGRGHGAEDDRSQDRVGSARRRPRGVTGCSAGGRMVGPTTSSNGVRVYLPTPARGRSIRDGDRGAPAAQLKYQNRQQLDPRAPRRSQGDYPQSEAPAWPAAGRRRQSRRLRQDAVQFLPARRRKRDARRQTSRCSTDQHAGNPADALEGGRLRLAAADARPNLVKAIVTLEPRHADPRRRAGKGG